VGDSALFLQVSRAFSPGPEWHVGCAGEKPSRVARGHRQGVFEEIGTGTQAHLAAEQAHGVIPCKTPGDGITLFEESK